MRRVMAILVASIVVVGVAACSGKTAGDQDSGSKSGNGAIAIDTDDGKVKLPKAASRVVSLEWLYTEDLLALGVTPVGAADVEGYNDWVSSTEPLGDDTANVGTRQEPSIERIKSLQPDLIIADTNRTDISFDELGKIAPLATFTVNGSDRDQLDSMEFIVTQLGVATGKEEKAKKQLDDFDDNVSAAATALKKSSTADKPIALSQAYTMDGTPELRMFGDSSMAGEILHKIGLKNAWQGKADDWGMTTTGVESLTKLPDNTNFLYLALKSDDPFTGALADNEVWKDLKFVKDDRVNALDSGTWLFGGVASANQLIDESVRVLDQ